MKTTFPALCFLLSSGLSAQNVVTDWARIVQPAINTPPKPPAIQFILQATVQLAVYEAVNAIQGGYHPFTVIIPAARDADIRAAVASAAYRTARARVDASQVPVLDTQYQAYMMQVPAGPARNEGVRVGATAAEAVLALRADDGVNRGVLYQCSANPPPAGEFEPDGGCGTQPVGANVGQIKPFTFERSNRFRPGGPDSTNSAAYEEDFTETRDYGRANSMVRTPEQTDIAYFWQAVDTHKGLTDLAIRRALSVRDTARFLAMVYVAGADANIAGYEAKYFYRFWRPRTAIPRADTDGNSDTGADLTWTPLISVNHPEYPSAHAYSSAAVTETIARFFGTNKVTWTLTASRATFPQLVKTERTYDDMNAVMREIYNARIWAGLHWRNSLLDGAKIGRKVAKHVCDSFFKPKS